MLLKLRKTKGNQYFQYFLKHILAQIHKNTSFQVTPILVYLLVFNISLKFSVILEKRILAGRQYVLVNAKEWI